jgi:hypothetical protein
MIWILRLYHNFKEEIMQLQNIKLFAVDNF